MIVAETERLILRHFIPTDIDPLALIVADPEVMRFSEKGVKTRAEAEDFLDAMLYHYQKHGFGLYAVIHKESSELIGYCGLLLWTIDDRQETEIGYRLATAYWGSGLATEAAKAVRDYGWQFTQGNGLICIIESANHRSIRVAEKLGMKHEKDTAFKKIKVRIYRLQSWE
ncbi:MAG: GNAT family N-acetyltransferase [Xenococcaceae cyanobacterium MO_167.B52]|nr:GNAT family N-acetyltransferase [Xenococcaceae cyanobacterium MO_167.B52]